MKKLVVVIFVLFGLFLDPAESSVQSEGVIQGVVEAKVDRSLLVGITLFLEGAGIRAPLETTLKSEGRLVFSNPITAGFTTEADHIASADRFLAPMDQTHTLTSGVTYRHRKTGLWTSLAIISLQLNVENLTNNMHLVARESVYTPGQYSIPRLFSGSIETHF